jgi:hypothetical protein
MKGSLRSERLARGMRAEKETNKKDVGMQMHSKMDGAAHSTNISPTLKSIDL